MVEESNKPSYPRKVIINIPSEHTELQPTNPEFSNYRSFAKYCYLYDPLVDTKTVTAFDEATFEYQERWHRRGFIYLNEYVTRYPLQYYYSCLAYHREQLLPGKALKLVENFQKKTASYEEDNRNRCRLLNELDRNINQTFILKQYIYYRCNNGQDGWSIFLRSPNVKVESDRPFIIGKGKTLQEADTDFNQMKARNFTKITNIDNILKFLGENNVPVNAKEMIDVCVTFDSKIYKSNVIHQNHGRKITATLAARYTFQCSSEETTFCLDVNLYSQNINWKVTKYLNLDDQSSLISKLSIEASATTIKEAYYTCIKKSKELQEDNDALNKAIHEAEQLELKLIEEDMIRDGEDTFNWLVSEFGDDIIPDRG
ncbi:hypothetical protein [Anabaena sp. 4-3]|uniref:hypothetical protein n=1 Tax=Anabaena sp. 4-3 TaxID=1811979 RepID=UPI00082EF2DF|nr:hypothetical protein [Anabaena sp. 4-3]